MNRNCENCLKRKTMLCPNSDKCYALDNKPYYVDKENAIKEIQRLNKECDTYMKIATKRGNIIEELEKYIEENIKITKQALKFEGLNDIDKKKYSRDISLFEMILDKLKELKGSDK